MSPRTPAVPGRRPRRRGGFTLIEACTATAIIGIAFTAMLQLLAAGTVANREGAELTTGIHLAGQVHERAMRVSYANVFGLEGTHSPPRDANGDAMADMNGWQQVVDVTYVDRNLLRNNVPDDQVEPTARITVTVNRNGQFVHRASWLTSASQ